MEQKQHFPIWYIILPPVALAIITTIIYYPSLHYAFQFDDLPNITKHFNIRHNTLSDLFFTGSRWISYWLNAIHYSIGKFDPYSYRVGNLIIHIFNGTFLFSLFYLLLSKLKNNFFSRYALSIATLTTALFLLHPVHTQTVSYVIQGELEGLATLSVLFLALLYVMRAQCTHAFTKAAITILLLFSAALACSTKEITIVTPALLLIIDWFFLAQGDMRSLRSRAFILGGITATMGAVYLYFLKPAFFFTVLTFNHVMRNNIGNVLTQNPTDIIKPFQFFISQFKVIVHYLTMYLWPFNISVEYDWKLSNSIFDIDVVVPFLILVGLGYCIVLLLKKNRINPIVCGAVWFFICVAPRSSFIPSSELLADYKAYLASIGWLFIIASGIIFLFDRAIVFLQKKRLSAQNSYFANSAISICMFALICLPLVLMTKEQNKIWSSGIEFWGAMIKNAPGKARAYNNYGVELSQNLSLWKEAIPYYKKAIEMDKNYADPCNNLAVTYAQLNDIDNAILAMKQALAINRNYPEGYNNLAAFYLQKKDYNQAIESLKIALKLRPHYGKAYFNLGRTYMELGKMEDAWQAFKDCCCKADLDNAIGFGCYAQSSFSLKKYEDAIFGFKKVLEFDPKNEQALFNLANSYFMIGKYQDAIQAYECMLTHYPNDHRALFNAGEASLKLKNPGQALAYFERCEQSPNLPPAVNQRLASCKKMALNC